MQLVGKANIDCDKLNLNSVRNNKNSMFKIYSSATLCYKDKRFTNYYFS